MNTPPSAVFHALAHGMEDALDAQGGLADHVKCCACGYDLFSMKPGQQCPECGAPVGMSMKGDILAAAASPWLTWVGQSTRIAGIALLPIPLILVANWLFRLGGGFWLFALVACLLAYSIAALLSLRSEPGMFDDPPRLIVIGRVAIIFHMVALVACGTVIAYSPSLAWAGAFAALIVFHGSLIVFCRGASSVIIRAPYPDLANDLHQRPVWMCIIAAALLLDLWLSPFGACLTVALLLPAWCAYMWLIGYNLITAGDLLIGIARDAEEHRKRAEFWLTKP